MGKLDVRAAYRAAMWRANVKRLREIERELDAQILAAYLAAPAS